VAGRVIRPDRAAVVQCTAIGLWSNAAISQHVLPASAGPSAGRGAAQKHEYYIQLAHHPAASSIAAAAPSKITAMLGA
jgi:hypothetical protein